MQFANALFAIGRCSLLSNNEFMYQDLFIVFILALTLGATPSARRLTRKRPSGRLLSPYNVVLCASFIIITFILQAIVVVRAQRSDWYSATDAAGNPVYPKRQPVDTDSEGTNSAIPETTSVFLLANAQYAAVATIFSNGWPWKRPVWYNWPFCGWLVLSSFISALLLLSPQPQRNVADSLISLESLPYSWYLELLGWSIGALVAYALGIGACYELKRRGGFSAIDRACTQCYRRRAKVEEKLHKRLRREWREFFANGRSISVVQVAGDRAEARPPDSVGHHVSGDDAAVAFASLSRQRQDRSVPLMLSSGDPIH